MPLIESMTSQSSTLDRNVCALQAASAIGDQQIMKLLLDHGVNDV
jgi:hypothetical protein